MSFNVRSYSSGKYENDCERAIQASYLDAQRNQTILDKQDAELKKAIEASLQDQAKPSSDKKLEDDIDRALNTHDEPKNTQSVILKSSEYQNECPIKPNTSNLHI